MTCLKIFYKIITFLLISYKCDINRKLSNILDATTDFYVDTKIAENYLEDPLIPFW